MADPLEDALNQMSTNLAPVDQINAQQPDQSLNVQPSLAFGMANTGSSTGLSGQYRLLAQYSTQQNTTQATSDPGPQSQTPADPVVGTAPVHPVHKHSGLLGHFAGVMNVLGAPKRLLDHLDRLAKSAGVPGWVMPALGGIGAVAGAVLAPEAIPFAAIGLGAAGGASTAAAIGAIEHATKGDLGPAWKASMHGKTMGQLFADEVPLLRNNPTAYKIISGTADAGMAMSTDPSSYLATPFKALRGAREIPTATEDVIHQFIQDHGPVSNFVDWARGKNPYLVMKQALASGAHIPQATAIALSDAKTAADGARALAQHAALYGARDDKFAIDRLPALYKNPIARSIQDLHAWEGPRLLHVTPSAEWDWSNEAFDQVDQAKKQFETWYMHGVNAPALGEGSVNPLSRASYDMFINNKMNDFVRGTADDRLRMLVAAQRDGLASLGLSDAQINRLANEHNWLGLSRLQDLSESIKQGKVLDTFAVPTYRDVGEARRLGLTRLAGSAPADPGAIADLQRSVDAAQAAANSASAIERPEALAALEKAKTDLGMAKAAGTRGTGVTARALTAGASLESKATKVTNAMKVLWLARPAFALRVMMDESLNGMARFGTHPLQWLNEASDSWIKHYTRDPNALFGHGRGVGDMLQSLSDHFGKEVDGFNDLAPVRVAPKEVLSGGLDKIARAKPTAQETAVKWLAQEGKAGGFQGSFIKRGEAGYERSWVQILNYHIRRDPVGKAMLNVYDGNPQQILEAGAKAFADHPDATPPKVMYDMMFKGPKTSAIEPMVPRDLLPVLRDGDVGLQDIRGVSKGSTPLNVWGTDSSAGAPSTLLHRFSEGTHHMTSTLLNNTTRNPVWQMQYQKSFQNLVKRAEASGALGTEISREDLAQLAASSTTRDVLSAIHRPMERTRFDVLTKSFIPFNYAWIQFAKRWGTSFEKNPALIRGLANTMAAGRTDGWFDTNPYGQTEWHFPVGNDFVQHFLSIEAPQSNVPFVPPLLPFSSQTLPGFSPVLTVPASYLTTHALPVFSKNAEDKALSVENMLFGPSFGTLNQPGHGFANTVLSQVAPSWLNKLATGFQGDVRDNAFGKSLISALSYHTMKGDFNAPARPANMSDQDYQKLSMDHWNAEYDKVKSEVKMLYYAQAVEAFFSPYSPLPNTDGMQIPSDIRQMKTQYGPELGTAMALKKYGTNAEGYLTSYTQANKGTAPTQEFQDFYNNNPGFFNTYPDVAGFFAPQKGQFNSFAYQEQKITGQRQMLTPNEWLLKVAIRSGDDEFYNNVKPAYDAAVADGISTKALQPWYAAQKQQIDEKFPGWMAWRNSASAREAARVSAIQQLNLAANDPQTDRMPGVAPLREFLQHYQLVKQSLQTMGLSSITSKTAQPLRTFLINDYNRLSNKGADVGPLTEAYQYLFRYELNDFSTQNTPASATSNLPVAGPV